MVTGDHPLTAAAIARQIGIITEFTKDQYAEVKGIPESEVNEQDYDAIVVAGPQLEKFDDAVNLQHHTAHRANPV